MLQGGWRLSKDYSSFVFVTDGLTGTIFGLIFVKVSFPLLECR